MLHLREKRKGQKRRIHKMGAIAWIFPQFNGLLPSTGVKTNRSQLFLSKSAADRPAKPDDSAA
jgi:hypothetical protein